MATNRPFILMEYFEGSNLNEVLKQRGVVRPDSALRLVREVASALGHAHANNIVHRDVSPRNILVAKQGKFRVIDFGLGLYIERELTSRLTRTGQAPAGGTHTCPDLLSDPKLCDPRCDLYSLGAVWFEMLVGRPPVGAGVESALGNIDGFSDVERDVLVNLIGPRPARLETGESVIEALAEVQHRAPNPYS